jgi:predicted membrane chloride channel (bestrophin family)
MTVLSALGRLVAASPALRIETKTHIDESLRDLQQVYATCHRILTTPIPLSYTRWVAEECMVCLQRGQGIPRG